MGRSGAGGCSDTGDQGERERIKEEAGIGAGGWMSDGGRGSTVKEAGVQGALQNHSSPRDSLVFVSRRLVINRLWSTCLTGWSLGFDGRTLISAENSRKTDGLTNRLISQKQALFYQPATPIYCLSHSSLFDSVPPK